MTSRLPSEVALAFARLPEVQRDELLAVRSLILAVSVEQGVGPLTETLKWGEPAYLTEISKAGSTIRLGITKSTPLQSAVLFNCKTTLVNDFRTRFSKGFTFEGNRALILASDGAWSRDGLAICLAEALTYHRRKSIK